MATKNNFKDLIPIAEFARLRKVSRQTIYNWLKSGTAPRHERIGGRYFFYRSENETQPDRIDE